ncbi:MAG: diacylglycerol kinase family protein [Acidimicrobiales bacterium]|nr:diacylglycerol kinase family protein [Acidimicrobiales bacterium]
MSDVHVLISPDAGRGRTAGTSDDVLDHLRALGAHVIDISGASVEGSQNNAREAVAGGAKRLIVLGGDGIMHIGLQAVAGTGTVLGVIPIGTGNDFARGLEWIPDDPVEAAAVALHDPMALDALRCGNHWVASVATAGFSSDVNERANRLSRPKGPSRYTVATILQLPQLTARSLRLDIDGEVITHAATMLAVANTAWFGGGMHIAPDADPTDGYLDITVVADVGRLELLRFFSRVFNGTHMSHPKVHGYRGRSVRVATDEPLVLWGDGEFLGPTPCTIESVPGALQIAR